MTGWNLSTPESEAAYEAEYGPVSPGGNEPEPEPWLTDKPTPYELWLTDDPKAGWDDPGLKGPADREIEAEAGA